jgi:hypothetical protein
MPFPLRIVTDALRRLWLLYAIAAAAILAIESLNRAALADGVQLFTPADVYAWCLAVTWLLAIAPVSALELREVWLLSVSRRQLWIAYWSLAVVAPILVIAIATGLAELVTSGSGFGADRMVLLILFATIYGGSQTALKAFSPLPQSVGTNRWKIFPTPLLLIAGLVMPFRFSSYLPLTFSDFNGTVVVVSIIAASLTVAAYFHRPPIVAHRAVSRQKETERSGNHETVLRARLSGMPFLYWKEGRKALTIYGSFLLVGLAYWWFFESGSKTIGEAITFNGFDGFLAQGGALIFAAPLTGPVPYFPALLVLVAIGTSDFGQTGEIRGLRTLPLSAARLSAVLVSFGVLSAAMLWIVLLVAHVTATGAPPTSLRPDLFSVVSGAMALSMAVQFKLPGNQFTKALGSAVVVAPALTLLSLARGFETTSAGHVVMIVGGGAALTVAWLMNRRTLRHGRRIYKRPHTPLALISS